MPFVPAGSHAGLRAPGHICLCPGLWAPSRASHPRLHIGTPRGVQRITEAWAPPPPVKSFSLEVGPCHWHFVKILGDCNLQGEVTESEPVFSLSPPWALRAGRLCSSPSGGVITQIPLLGNSHAPCGPPEHQAHAPCRPQGHSPCGPAYRWFMPGHCLATAHRTRQSHPRTCPVIPM